MGDQHPLLGGILGTDQYQLAMAQVYWREGLADRPAQFDYFFRSYPDYGIHQAGYCVTAGLGWLLDWMEKNRFGDPELQALRQQRGPDGHHRFDEGFIDWLAATGDFSAIEVMAVAEGRVVHANAPVAIVRGPLAMAQILETPFLNRMNYPTLIATKASRVKEAAGDGLVLEFGMRRGPVDGADAGGRAALIGGCDFTSNVALSHAMGLDPKGTHAHSMVQVFMAMGDGELEAFRAFASVYPDDCVLLVDTIDVLGSGVPNAITVFEELRADGHQPRGIRLDSGDLAYLAVQSAILLDEAGFPEVSIVLSSDLDELAIWQILSQIESEAGRYGTDSAAIVSRLTYGVGTRLITSNGDSALSGVYKLVAVGENGGWTPAIKVSESVTKIPAPGDKRVWRFYDQRGFATADVVALADEEPTAADRHILYHPQRDTFRTVNSDDISEIEAMLTTVFTGGHPVGDPPTLTTMRERRISDLERLDPGVRRLVSPHVYHVSLTDKMKELQQALIKQAIDGG